MTDIEKILGHADDGQWHDVTEPDNPTAYNLAHWIADHSVSDVQQAFRLLGMRLTFDLVEEGEGSEGKERQK